MRVKCPHLRLQDTIQYVDRVLSDLRREVWGRRVRGGRRVVEGFFRTTPGFSLYGSSPRHVLSPPVLPTFQKVPFLLDSSEQVVDSQRSTSLTPSPQFIEDTRHSVVHIINPELTSVGLTSWTWSRWPLSRRVYNQSYDIKHKCFTNTEKEEERVRILWCDDGHEIYVESE